MGNNNHHSGNSKAIAAHGRNINIGLFAVILIAACLAVYSSLNIMHITGPTSLVESRDGNITIALSDRFFTVNKDGSVLNERDFETLGIQGLVNDIQALANGDLIIGDGGSRALYRCDGQLVSCAPLRSDMGAAHYDIGKYHKFYVDENNQKIILSNTERHELVLLNMDGSLNTSLIPKSGPLGFPDGIVIANQDQILLANATKKQLLRIDISANKATIIGTYAIESKYTTEGQVLPTTLSRVSENNWWVAAQASSLTGIGASVLKFDDQLNPVGRLIYEDFVHPVDILDVGAFVLIADMHAYRIFASDHAGRSTHIFGDDVINTALEEQKTSKELNTYLRWLSIGALVVTLGLALFIEGIRNKEKQRQEDLERASLPQDQLKLNIPESVTKMFRIMPIIILIPMGVSGFLLFGSMPESVITVGVPAFLIGAIVLVALFMTARQIPKSIEINADTVTITTHNNEIASDLIENITYTDHAICINDEYFNIGTKGALLKNKAGYSKMMMLLRNATKLNYWAYQKRIYKKERASYALIAALLIVIVLIQLTNTSSIDADKEKEVIHEVLIS